MKVEFNTRPKAKIFNRYQIIGSQIPNIQKGRLMYETHLKTAADQLNYHCVKIGNSIFFCNEKREVFLKADLINK